MNTDELQGLSPEDRAIVLKEYAKTVAGKRNPSETEVIELIMSPAGVAMQLWLSARDAEPSLTIAELRKLINEDNVIDVMVELDVAVAELIAAELAAKQSETTTAK